MNVGTGLGMGVSSQELGLEILGLPTGIKCVVSFLISMPWWGAEGEEKGDAWKLLTNDKNGVNILITNTFVYSLEI